MTGWIRLIFNKVKLIDALEKRRNLSIIYYRSVVGYFFSVSRWVLDFFVEVIANSKSYDTFVIFASIPYRTVPSLKISYKCSNCYANNNRAEPLYLPAVCCVCHYNLVLLILKSMRTTSIAMIKIDDSPNQSIYIFIRFLCRSCVSHRFTINI